MPGNVHTYAYIFEASRHLCGSAAHRLVLVVGARALPTAPAKKRCRYLVLVFSANPELAWPAHVSYVECVLLVSLLPASVPDGVGPWHTNLYSTRSCQRHRPALPCASACGVGKGCNALPCATLIRYRLVHKAPPPCLSAYLRSTSALALASQRSRRPLCLRLCIALGVTVCMKATISSSSLRWPSMATCSTGWQWATNARCHAPVSGSCVWW